MSWFKKLFVWTRIKRLEDEFTSKKVEVKALRKLVNKPEAETWGICPEIRQLRDLVENMPGGEED